MPHFLEQHSSIETHVVGGKTWFVYHDDTFIWFFESKALLASCYVERRHTTSPAHWNTRLLNSRCVKRYNRILESIWKPSTDRLIANVEPSILQTLEQSYLQKQYIINGLAFCFDNDKLWFPDSTLFYDAKSNQVCAYREESSQTSVFVSLSDKKCLYQLKN